MTQESLWDIVARLDVPGIEGLFIADPSRLVTKWAAGVTERFAYCEQFNTQPFAGAYDDQPNWWVSAVGVIKHAREQASKWKAKHGN